MPQLHDETFAAALRRAIGVEKSGHTLEEKLARIPSVESLSDLPTGTPVWVRADLDPILARRAADRERWRALGEVRDEVVVFDLVGRGVGSPGLTAYDLFPACTYTVSLLATVGAVKVGVGWNPWGGPRSHDLGKLCEIIVEEG